jgi:predicted tellurium resistance membrane protein TerC
MESLFTMDALISLLTLTSLEVVLGIDNIVFLTILVGKLPGHQQDKARRLGIALALFMRLALLFSISWVMSLTDPLFAAFGQEISGRDLILILGGGFLIAKATYEIHEKLEAGDDPLHESGSPAALSAARSKFAMVLTQIVLVDIVFSLDSVITAVGMAQQIWIMVAAMVISVAVMLFSAKAIGDMVNRHPTIKILALSFLILIGVTLLMEGLGSHVSKGYIYFAMAFSLVVELLNIRFRKKSRPVVLHEPRL